MPRAGAREKRHSHKHTNHTLSLSLRKSSKCTGMGDDLNNLKYLRNNNSSRMARVVACALSACIVTWLQLFRNANNFDTVVLPLSA